MPRNPRHTIALVSSLIALPLAALASSQEQEFAAAYAQYEQAIEEKDYSTALVYARKSYQLASSEFGGDHSKTGVLAYNLGAVHYKLERYRDSIEPLQQATESYRKEYGPDALDTLLPTRKLAMAYAALENWPEAEKNYLEAVRILEVQKGRNAEPIADLLISLISAAEEQKEFSRTRNYGRRALYILDRAGHTRDLRSGRVHVSLVAAELQLGDGRAGLKHLSWAIEIYEEVLPEGNSELNSLYAIAAQVYEQVGNGAASRKYRRRLQTATE